MSDFTEAQWAAAGRQVRAHMEAVRAPIRRAVAAEAVRGLEAVDFASAAARDLAKGAGLSWPAFQGFEPGSDRGYTAKDVRAIIAGA